MRMILSQLAQICTQIMHIQGGLPISGERSCPSPPAPPRWRSTGSTRSQAGRTRHLLRNSGRSGHVWQDAINPAQEGAAGRQHSRACCRFVAHCMATPGRTIARRLRQYWRTVPLIVALTETHAMKLNHLNLTVPNVPEAHPYPSNIKLSQPSPRCEPARIAFTSRDGKNHPFEWHHRQLFRA